LQMTTNWALIWSSRSHRFMCLRLPKELEMVCIVGRFPQPRDRPASIIWPGPHMCLDLSMFYERIRDLETEVTDIDSKSWKTNEMYM